MIIKKNKYIILSFILMLIIVCLSFFQFYKENFSYVKGYYEIKEKCYEGKKPDDDICTVLFHDREHLEQYIINNNPFEVYKKIDVITLTCSIVETSKFTLLQYFSPLIILFAFIGTVHSTFSSGMIKNYFLRMSYKDFMKIIFRQIMKVSLITPLALILIFIMAMLFTKFNFVVDKSVQSLSVYSQWKYSHFILYGVIICVAQFFLNILYCNIGLYCCKKNKNSIVATIMGYIMFILVEILIYVVIYVFIINRILGFSELTEFFHIAGYWFFNFGPSCAYVVLISFLIQLISTILVVLCYRKKESVLITNEKQFS